MDHQKEIAERLRKVAGELRKQLRMSVDILNDVVLNVEALEEVIDAAFDFGEQPGDGA